MATIALDIERYLSQFAKGQLNKEQYKSLEKIGIDAFSKQAEGIDKLILEKTLQEAVVLLSESIKTNSMDTMIPMCETFNPDEPLNKLQAIYSEALGLSDSEVRILPCEEVLDQVVRFLMSSKARVLASAEYSDDEAEISFKKLILASVAMLASQDFDPVNGNFDTSVKMMHNIYQEDKTEIIFCFGSRLGSSFSASKLRDKKLSDSSVHLIVALEVVHIVTSLSIRDALKNGVTINDKFQDLLRTISGKNGGSLYQKAASCMTLKQSFNEDEKAILTRILESKITTSGVRIVGVPYVELSDDFRAKMTIYNAVIRTRDLTPSLRQRALEYESTDKGLTKVIKGKTSVSSGISARAAF